MVKHRTYVVNNRWPVGFKFKIMLKIPWPSLAHNIRSIIHSCLNSERSFREKECAPNMYVFRTASHIRRGARDEGLCFLKVFIS